MKEALTSPPQDPVNPHEYEPVEYTQLVGHARTDGAYKSSEQLRSEYVRLTDSLIHQITTGTEVINPVTGETEIKKPDVVVWLDKSARPVSWLTRSLWKELATDENGDTPEMPDMKFVNIDREQWVNQVDPNGSGLMNIDRIDKSIIQSLRSIFVEPKHRQGAIGDHIDAAPSSLDGKTVLIVDEVYSSGRTLDIAEKFFRRAFPTASVGGAHWMKGIATKGSATGNADIPVWYKDKDVTGRGVGNREEETSRLSRSETQRLGAMFLSTRFEKPDEASIQLHKEINKLAQDVVKHEVLVVPAISREDYEERAARLNDMSFDEFISVKQGMAGRAEEESKKRFRR
jgi:hypothetical protein